MSLTVKAYLTRAGQRGDPEIRRFGVDTDVCSNYNYFVSKLTAIFPGLSGKTYSLGWRDSENDLVLFSSDEELTEALGYVNDGIFKVYITEKGEATNQGLGADKPCEWKRGPRVHWGVTCDGCQGSVVGLRFKCEVCPDFDLCEGCKGKNIHSEHPLKTIEKTRRCHFGFGGEGPAAGEHSGPFPCPPPPCYPGFGGASGMGFVPAFLRGCNIDFDAMPPHMARKIQRKLFKKFMCEKYGKFCKKARKCEKRKEEKKLKKKEKKEKKLAKEKEAKAGEEKDVEEGEQKERKRKDSTSSSSSSSSSSSDEGEEQSPEGYLKNVGESVAAMLDPLGIDVEVDIEHNGMRRRCQRGEWFGFGRGGMGMGFGSGRGGMHFGGGHGGWGGGWGGLWGGRGGPCGGRRGRGGWFCPPGATGYANTKMDTGEAAKNDAGPNVSPPRDPEWTFIPPPGSDVEGAAQGVENMHVTPDAGTVPSTSDASAATSSAAPNVAEAVAKMQSMGYTDEGGWLTALLAVHNGDVNLALDALQAKK